MRVIVASFFLLASVGCETVSIRFVDASTGQPLKGVPVQLWVKQGDLTDLLMGLPGDTIVDAAAVTDGKGKVVFRTGKFRYINFRGGKDGSLPHLYRLGSEWYIDRVGGTGPAKIDEWDVVVPLTREEMQPVRVGGVPGTENAGDVN